MWDLVHQLVGWTWGVDHADHMSLYAGIMINIF